MSTAHVAASAREKPQAPQSPAPAPSTHTRRSSQRKPRANRTQHGPHHLAGTGASPGKAASRADPASTHGCLPDSSSTGPRHTSATPVKAQAAYAGPTFHASPAPSALPIPKFLSRSVPAKPQTCPPTPPPEDSFDSTNSPSLSPNSPSRAPIQAHARNEDSPLDVLFKADRAERARQAIASPPSANRFGPTHPPRPPHYHPDSSNPANGLFSMDLDGENQVAPFPIPHRAVTDPHKVPQLRDNSAQNGSNDIMHDLLNRLSLSQKKSTIASPPRQADQANPEAQRKTPSPSQPGRMAVRSTSGPSTPIPAQPDESSLFYGNRNLSPMFKAAKNGSPKRNSGLRTEITTGPPAVTQALFQDLPATALAHRKDHNTLTSHHPKLAMTGPGNAASPNFRHGSTPLHQPYQQSPSNRRTSGQPPQYPRAFHGPRANMSSPGPRSGSTYGHTQPVNVPKSTTSMMSFVPSSVSAKQHSSSAPPAATIPPPAKTGVSSDTSIIEQDLKRLLNLKIPAPQSSAH